VISFAVVLVVVCGVRYYFVGVLPTNQVHSEPAAGRTDVDPKAVAARASAGEPQTQLQMGILGLEKAIRPVEYREAGEWLRKAAEAGIVEAQYRLGTLYQSGRLAGQDPTNTVFWLEKAAAQRHVAALYNLGSMYGTGRGVTRDPQAAVRYFRQAAELGDAYAQYNLGNMYAEGRGVAKDYIRAHMWFNLAAVHGIQNASDNRDFILRYMSSTQVAKAQRLAREWKPTAPGS